MEISNPLRNVFLSADDDVVGPPGAAEARRQPQSAPPSGSLQSAPSSHPPVKWHGHSSLVAVAGSITRATLERSKASPRGAGCSCPWPLTGRTPSDRLRLRLARARPPAEIRRPSGAPHWGGEESRCPRKAHGRILSRPHGLRVNPGPCAGGATAWATRFSQLASRSQATQAMHQPRGVRFASHGSAATP